MQKTIEKENYLKAVYKMAEKSHKVSVTSISKHFNVSKSTVSNMIKKLVVMNLIDSKPYEPIILTKNGKKAAVEIIAKHRLIELYLVEEMQFSLDEVHEIAEEIEHIKNTKFFIRMQEILGDAQIDPHGSVIPKCDF
jgi:DtxR family Mn-dependent transcriptional regulator